MNKKAGGIPERALAWLVDGLSLNVREKSMSEDDGPLTFHSRYERGKIILDAPLPLSDATFLTIQISTITKKAKSNKNHPFRGMPVVLDDPFEPVIPAE